MKYLLTQEEYDELMLNANDVTTTEEILHSITMAKTEILNIDMKNSVTVTFNDTTTLPDGLQEAIAKSLDMTRKGFRQ